jgi:hypothetical protein
MTMDEFRRHQDKVKPPKQSLYRNKKKTVNGFEFDSIKEANRHADLVLMQQAGNIRKLERQKEFELTVNGHLICSYVADFCYEQQIPAPKVAGVYWEPIVEDVKSKPTRKKRDYRIKKKLMLAVHSITIQEV